MSEWDEPTFAALPCWTQKSLFRPGLVCLDLRVWVDAFRRDWSMATQVASGLDRKVEHLAVGPRVRMASPEQVRRAAHDQLDRLLDAWVDSPSDQPFPAA